MRLSTGLCKAPYLLRPVVLAGNGAGGWLALHEALALAGYAGYADGPVTSLSRAIRLVSELPSTARTSLEAAVDMHGRQADAPLHPLRLVEDNTKIMVVGGWDPASQQDDKLEHTTPHVMTRWMDSDDFQRAPITVFKKFPSGVAEPGGPIALPLVSLVGSAPVSGRYVADAVLAVVIGRPALRIAPKDALDHVFGVSLMLDVWNDDVFVEEARVRRGMVARNLTRISPIGPWIECLRGDLVDAGLQVTLDVGGKVRQRFTLGDLAHSIGSVLSFCSSVGLTPGDVIGFGARIARGSGPGPLDTPCEIRPGQTVRVSAPGLATLTAEIVAGEGYVATEGAA